MNETPSRRPMTFTFLELLDRTFRLYRENFLTIIGLVALVTVPITIISYILNPIDAQPITTANAGANSATSLLSSLLGLVQTVLVNAPVTYIASEYLFNRKVSIGQAFSGTRNRFTKMGCGIILMGIFVVIVGVFAALLIVAIPPALALFGILAYIIIGAYALLFQVLTLEDIGPSAAVTRSYSLAKRRFWTVIGLGLVIMIISVLVGAIIGGSITFLITSTTSRQSATTQLLLIAFFSSIVSIFITPITPIAFTLLYYDIRTRTEGLDIMLDSSTPDTRPINLAIPETRFRIDRYDWRNIGILSLLGLVIGIVGGSALNAFIQQYSNILR